MDYQSPTVPMHFVLDLFWGVGLNNDERRDFLQQASIPAFLIDTPSGRVTVEQFACLYRLLVNAYDDETPGFFSRPLRGGTLKFLCMGLLDAPSLHVALHRYCQYFRVLLDDVSYQLVIEGEHASICFIEKTQLRGERVLVNELMLKLVHGIASWLISEKILPEKVSCAYPRPQHSAEYLYFYPGEVEFDQPWTALSFDREVLRKPIRQTRKNLSAFLRQAPAEWIFTTFDERLFSHRVRDYLSSHHLGNSVQVAAQALHLSTRTLSRRLAEEGTSFQAIKDEVRRDQAIQELAAGQQSLVSLAEQLGFEDLPSFNRAFKKWTGSTPGAYRRGQQPG
ncbi:transcriptional regulator, AraC family [Marinospirillum celere]|uniref:Transcriptional regulator, AraC family n=1 Tax=Marinospirillum celere TaxID=1122252 RepID=A0A1I1H473_9GAMM|nr:AraC family transcriptional regulator [Marinospirillum celere]SFC18342.1 transcriptional regulator, AraC family [Marinospirillum celere]